MLPGIRSAEQVLGLDPSEIARAVQAGPVAVERWVRQEEVPSAPILQRLSDLDALAAEVRRTMKSDVVEEWLVREVQAFGGRTPRQMIIAGHAQVVREALVSLNSGFRGQRSRGRAPAVPPAGAASSTGLVQARGSII